MSEVKRKQGRSNRLRNMSWKMYVLMACILLLGALLLNTGYGLYQKYVVIPGGKYSQALTLKTEGHYLEAICAFEELGRFRDSAGQITSCQEIIYQDAMGKMEEEDYVEAIGLLEDIAGYEDAAEQIENCKTKINEAKYETAVELESLGEYTKAADVYLEIVGFRDSRERRVWCKNQAKYIAALELKNSGCFEEAMTEFERLKDFEDSRAQISDCKYLRAASMVQAGNYEDAKDEYARLGKYKDSKEILSSEDFRYGIIETADVGAIVSLGRYELDNQTKEPEKLEWIVLAREDDRVLLLSRYAVEKMDYQRERTWKEKIDESFYTWENSIVREWLNSTFWNTAFNSEEKTHILQTHIEAEPDSIRENDTDDYVFLLSVKEVEEHLAKKYWRCFTYKYKHSFQSSFSNPEIDDWWLRTQSEKPLNGNAVYGNAVYVNGHNTYIGDTSTTLARGVRPAIWISIAPERRIDIERTCMYDHCQNKRSMIGQYCTEHICS